MQDPQRLQRMGELVELAQAADAACARAAARGRREDAHFYAGLGDTYRTAAATLADRSGPGHQVQLLGLAQRLVDGVPCGSGSYTRGLQGAALVAACAE